MSATKEIPQIEIIRCHWERERLIWLGTRATDNLAATDAYTKLNELMDSALDLGLIPTPA